RANATITVPPAADLAITKVANQTVVNYLDTVKFTLTVTNNGPDTGVNVRVTDLLPAGLQFLSANASQGSYNETTGIWTIGSLANGTVATLDIIAKVVASNTSIINVANVSSDIYDPDMSNNRANATITVPPAADLAITKAANQTSINYWDIVKFTLVVRNAGPDPAVGVLVTDELPSGLEFLSAIASHGTYDPVVGLWSVGYLSVGDLATLEIITRVIGSNETIDNMANVSSSIYDPELNNTRANITFNVPPAADLAIIKVVNATKVRYGDTVRFIIGVINFGPDTAVNVRVTDLLPAGLQFVSASSPSYDPVSGVWIIGNLSKGSIATLSIIARVVTSNKNITNVATVTSDIYDPDMGNNKASVTIEVGGRPPKPPSPWEVPMQPTGVPLVLMVFAVLSIIVGFSASRRY
ncbi:MAG: DUF11 domain-containing protein, partial [Methanothermobacter tenebrarum]